MEPHPSEWAGLPPALHALVEAERAVGNRVAAIDTGFPAPPVGFCVLLQKDVSTRPTDAEDGLLYRKWPNWKGYHGYSDARGHFFVLNPPLPLPPDPVMRWDEDGAWAPAESPRREVLPIQVAHNSPAPAPDAAPLERFRRSMDIDYEKWHDGIGYDLEALDALAGDARRSAEHLLLSRGARDWRDVEAMARLDTPACRDALRQALETGEAAIRLAVMRHAPGLLDSRMRTASLVTALETAAPFEGLTLAIDQMVAFHPPEVMEALWRGLSERDGGVAVHYAALLTYLHGRADSVFDLAQRPFFLTFNTADPDRRAAAVAALRERLAGASPIPDADTTP